MPDINIAENHPWNLVNTQDNLRSRLRNRWKFDADLISNEPYVFKGIDGKPEARAFSVTIPNAALFFAKIWALVAGVSRLPTINSTELSDQEKADIVHFLQDSDYEIDAVLSNRGKRTSFVTHAGYLCSRGWTVEQHLSRRGKNDEFLTDVRPLDPYGFTYDTDVYGMTWGCIETWRSKADIESQFGVVIDQPIGFVKDWWNNEEEIINIDNRKVDERDNPYGYPPFIVKSVAFGPGLLNLTNRLESEGESIFYPHRDMFEQLNFMASMAKTQAYDDLRPALQKEGKVLKDYPKPKSIAMVDSKLELVPIRGFTRAMQEFMRMVESIIQRSGLSAIDQGILTFPLAAVALAKMMAVKESLTLPRLQALSELYQLRTRMIIDQAQKFGETIEIGPEFTKRKYDTSKLSGPYTVTWKYKSSSLEDMAAKGAIGNALRGLLSDNDIRRDVLERENPMADEDALEVQEAKNQYPIIKLIERIFSLIDEDTDKSQAEAWILHHQLTTELKQRVAQGVQPIEPIKQPTSTQQLSVFSASGAGGPQPATKESQPRAEGEV